LPKLPLTKLSRFRTYVGIRSSRNRMSKLLAGYRFTRAVDVVRRLGKFDEHADEVESNLSHFQCV